MFFKTDYGFMQVKSIAECSKGSILQYFPPSFSSFKLMGPVPQFWIDVSQNFMQPIPTEKCYKDWQIILFERSVNGRRQWATDNGPSLYFKLTLSAIGSGEPKCQLLSFFWKYSQTSIIRSARDRRNLSNNR